jgi:hypothetical protein
MAINLETAFATVVHTVPPRARLETAFATVVHTAPPRARLETAFVTIVHTEAGATGGGGELPSGGSLVRKRDLVGGFAFQFVPKVEE